MERTPRAWLNDILKPLVDCHSPLLFNTSREIPSIFRYLNKLCNLSLNLLNLVSIRLIFFYWFTPILHLFENTVSSFTSGDI